MLQGLRKGEVAAEIQLFFCRLEAVESRGVSWKFLSKCLLLEMLPVKLCLKFEQVSVSSPRAGRTVSGVGAMTLSGSSASALWPNFLNA